MIYRRGDVVVRMTTDSRGGSYTHRGVVMEVADDRVILLQSTSTKPHGDDVVSVGSGTIWGRSLGWPDSDERCSYFHKDDLHDEPCNAPPSRLKPSHLRPIRCLI